MRTSLPAPPPGGAVPTGCPAVVSDALRTLPGSHSSVAAWTITAVVWIVVIALAALLLRAVCLEDLDGEEDGGDDEVSGHVRA